MDNKKITEWHDVPNDDGWHDVPDQKPKKTVLDRAKSVVEEAGIGGVLGAAAPEILSYGVAPALAASPMAPAAPFVYGAGQALRGSRLADRKSTRLNSSHIPLSRMPSSA